MILNTEKDKCIFVLSPHIDDGELACGATISKLSEINREIHFMVFSLAKKSIRPEFSKDATEKELHQSMKVLNISDKNLHIYDFEVRTFPSNRQEILEILWNLNKEYSPALVLTPSLNDLHQDHQVIAAETFRAFRNTSILCYEEPWNCITFNFTAFSKLSQKHVQKKVEALNCYKTQNHRAYFQPDYIWNWVKTRGTRVQCEYAEAFEVLRLFF
ncbi:MAG: PIG-L deacetylase family protein [Candidatus Helarchaeota archaeon]